MAGIPSAEVLRNQLNINNFVYQFIDNQLFTLMKEASLVKYYFTKYFFLALGLLQWFIGTVIMMQQGNTPKGTFVMLLFFTIGLVSFSLFLIFAAHFRRVAIGKKKIAIIGNRKAQRYDLDEVKWMRFHPVFNLYSLKMKGKKQIVYFLPCEEQQVIYGLFPTLSGAKK